MAKIYNGITGPFIGRVGNIVGYMLNGVNVMKQIPQYNAPKTPKQLANQQRMALVSTFATAIEDFLRFSFRSVATPDKLGPRNYAISVNKEKAVKGCYPDQQTDFEKMVVAAGHIPSPKNARLNRTENRLEFSWDADLETEGAGKRDQVMLLAYFPQTRKSVFITSGAYRTVGKEILQLPAFEEETVVETYMAFVADDRNDASPSVYLGKIILNESTAEQQASEVIQETAAADAYDLQNFINGQYLQSDKMAVISSFLSQFRKEIKVGYHSGNTLYSPFNRAVSHNIKTALYGTFDACKIDYPKLVFSKGKRESAWATRITAAPEKKITISWEVPETANMKLLGEDDVYLMLYNANQNTAIENTVSLKRKDLSATLQFQQVNPGDMIYAWIFFASPDGRSTSNSNYLGFVTALE